MTVMAASVSIDVNDYLFVGAPCASDVAPNSYPSAIGVIHPLTSVRGGVSFHGPRIADLAMPVGVT